MGKRSMATVLRIVVEIAWWLQVLGFVFAAGGLVATSLGFSGSTAAPLAFRLEPEAYQVDVGPLGGDARIIGSSASLQIEEPTLGLALGLDAWALFGMVIGLVMWYQVRAVARSFISEDAFVRDNVRRIRIVAAILIGWGLLQPLVLIGWNLFLGSSLVTSGISVTPGPETFVGLGRLVDGGLFAGLALLVLSEVFQRGTDLRDDQRLTV